jgi:hypothetical protein
MGKGDKVRLIDNKDHKYHGKGIIVKTQTISNNIVYITVEHKSSNTSGRIDKYKLI